jgi:hypothetical protein
MPESTALIPDPARLRQRLADLAREQRTLRQILRAVVSSPATTAALSLSPPVPAAPSASGGASDAH